MKTITPTVLKMLIILVSFYGFSQNQNIRVNGNAILIEDSTPGPQTPAQNNGTDFGSLNLGDNQVNTFTIENTFNGGNPNNNVLIINNITITGAHAADFIINSTINDIRRGNSENFTITFAPSGTGLRTALVTINNNSVEASKRSYTFNIQGRVETQQPQMTIRGNGININNGDTTPALNDGTDFGVADINNSSSNQIFVIRNTGGEDLILTGAAPYVEIIGANSQDFTITQIPVATIQPNNTTTFQISFNPTTIGIKTATVQIANNDTNNNPYAFSIQGTGALICDNQTITLPYFENFETGTNGWSSGGEFANRVNDGNWSYSANHSLRISANSGVTSSFCSPLFAPGIYDKIDLKFFFSARNVDANKRFVVEYSNDNGSSWVIAGTFISNNIANKNADFQRNNSVNPIFYSKTITLLKENFDFPQNNQARFRVRCLASDANDQIFIDDISITGVTYKSPTNAPGGVASNLDLWLKADAINGVSVGLDNSPVNKWIDNGRGNNAETVVSGQAPVYQHNPNRNFNFNPVVEFFNNNNSASSDMTYIINDGSRDELKGTGGFNSNDIFMVLMPEVDITPTMIPLDTFCSTNPLGNTQAEDVTGFGYGNYTARFNGEKFSYCIGTTNGLNNGYGRAATENLDYNQIGIINTRHNDANNGIEIYLNSNNIGNITSDPNAFTEIKNTRYWIGRSQYWNGSFKGRIAELITYKATNNDNDDTRERNRIQSYLAIKFGITLGVNGESQHYVDSDGNIIWNQINNTGYNFDITGIGRDDASKLYQKQSRSVNKAQDAIGKTQGILTIGLGEIFETNFDNPNTIQNKQFLIWGNDGKNLNDAASEVVVDMSSAITPFIPGGSPVQFKGIARTWKVVEIGGDFPEVEVAILKSAIRTATPPNGRYLMFISSTPNFDPTADYRVMTEDINEIGEAILKTKYDFDNTKYVTFGWAPEVVYERSIYFNGTTDYVDMEDQFNLNLPEFTISAWIKREAGSENKSILSKRDAAFIQGYDFRINSSGQVEISWKNGTTQTLTSNTLIPLNQWHQVAVIYNGGTTSLYIDGFLDKQATLSAPSATNESFYIGAAGKLTPTDLFSGNIDEVRIWSTALTPAQLRFIMNQEIEENTGFVNGSYFNSRGIIPTKNEISTISWNKLEGYYPMSTYTYTNTKDESGNSRQGALRNLRTVDRQTAPLPYISGSNGDWNNNNSWVNGDVQYIPGSTSIVDPMETVDWNIVRTNHNLTLDNSGLPANKNDNRSLLSLEVESNTLTANGNNAANEGNGLTISHYLKLDGTIDLEGESQLIQTLDSDFDVTSSGRLERDQQGTADKFTYNYWSSPVGLRNITTNNNSYTLPTILQDGNNPITFISAGFNGTNTSPVGIADYWIWKFANQASGQYSAWQHVRSTGSILTGEGFTMKGPGTGAVVDDQNYVFNGKPNNGDINLTLAANSDYLVGNPYPSALNAEQFILDNGPEGTNSLTGTLYFWEHWGGGSHILRVYQGGYATFNLSGGLPSANQGVNHPDVGMGGTPRKTPGRYIPVSQGFFVT
ncbi:choice-of-anchor D domain-containing protein, partial [Paucihalobacter sp.]|uniref:choice-of-anchor D domain-containing protein n=1 Tax=Paucihalobacter sp. TaxID=2850405 RepID=UPI002FE0079F